MKLSASQPASNCAQQKSAGCEREQVRGCDKRGKQQSNSTIG
jgi:hypothetical protein